jgi:O-antigen/teichoic acid export membrane protein
VLLIIVDLIFDDYMLISFVGLGVFNLILSKAYWQAVDKPRSYLIYSIVSKLAIIFLIIIVKITPINYPIYLSIIQGVLLLFVFCIYIYRGGLIKVLKFGDIKQLLIKCFPYLSSDVSVKTYTHLPRLLLGTLDPYSLTIYDFFEKIYLFSRLPNQVLFDSYFAEIMTFNNTKLIKLWKLYLFLGIALSSIVTLAMPIIYQFFLHKIYELKISYLLFGFLNLIIAINVFVGYGIVQMKIGINKYRKAVLNGMILFLFLITCMFYIGRLDFDSLVILLLLVESTIFFINLRYVYNEGIRLFNCR